ncbi:MAG: phenylalanine--tRNA ligase subunit beta [Ideonella sp.]|jgi:phenylalanyl-tRNA synthetase beta chain|nr:phenylalanine--tRNA ligase subunit beta [Ideonella sp.]
MQFPESWLREFCDPPLSTQDLADLLTMSGLEVEDLRPVAPPFNGVVVAEVLAVEPHPNAERLRVCRVSTGGPEALTIVCGAPNVRAGMKAPLATVGANLPPSEPGGAALRIGVGKLRGVESRGMLCSARELGLSDDHGGLLDLPADAPVGVDLRSALRLDDTLFTLKLTPNLGHLLGIYGIAREVSALTGAPLKSPTFAPAPPMIADVLPVRVEATDLCGRFSGRIVRHVDPKAPTPAWMVDRLARCGQRSVSALVDISNYVMFELGRPSHIFDLEKIHGGLVVRWGREGESLELLNGSTITVDGTVGVIADDRQVESLAGIMGGEATAVGDDTRHVYLEAAFWWPEAVAGRSRRFNFSTDAGHRFERGVDPATTVEHLERITQLVLDICGTPETVCGPMDDQPVAMPARAPVALRVERASRVIGMPVTQAQCADVFRRLGLGCTQSPGVLTVTPPSWRFDLTLEEDLIEEVVRVLGYHTLPTDPPRAPLQALVRSESRRSTSWLRRQLAALDYSETINFSFVDAAWERDLAGNADPVRVLNPIASNLAVMRSNLFGGLLQVLRTNLARKVTRVRVFEVGRAYLRDPAATDGPDCVRGLRQPLRVAGLAYGPVDDLQWGVPERQVDVFDAKGDLEQLVWPLRPRLTAAPHPALHPGRSAQVWLADRPIGWIGELHPRWRQSLELPQAPMLWELDVQALSSVPLPAAQPVSRLPGVTRDLALVAPDAVTHDDLMTAIAGAAQPLVRSARLFDVFRPSQPTPELASGERSLAVRLELRDDAGTLTDGRIDECVRQVLAAVTRTLPVRLRS